MRRPWGFRASDGSNAARARVGGFGEMEEEIAKARMRVDGETTHADEMRNARVDERFRCERRETDEWWIDVMC